MKQATEIQDALQHLLEQLAQALARTPVNEYAQQVKISEFRPAQPPRRYDVYAAYTEQRKDAR